MPISTSHKSNSKSFPRTNGTFRQGSFTRRLYSTIGSPGRDMPRQRASPGFESREIRSGYNQKRIGRNSGTMKKLSTNVSVQSVSWPFVHIPQLFFKANTSERPFPHTIPRTCVRETNGGGLNYHYGNLAHFILCPLAL